MILYEAISKMGCNQCKKRGVKCVWPSMKRQVKSMVTTGCQGDNNIKRKMAYRIAARRIHGKLGPRVRKQLPDCVVSGVRELFPDEDGNYMGYKES